MSAEPTSRDYTAIDEPSLLTALSDDAMAWAVAFNQHAVKLGYSSMDEGWLCGWLRLLRANAIEHSNDVRHWRSQPQTRPATGVLPKPRDTP